MGLLSFARIYSRICPKSEKISKINYMTPLRVLCLPDTRQIHHMTPYYSREAKNVVCESNKRDFFFVEYFSSLTFFEKRKIFKKERKK